MFVRAYVHEFRPGVIRKDRRMNVAWAKFFEEYNEEIQTGGYSDSHLTRWRLVNAHTSLHEPLVQPEKVEKKEVSRVESLTSNKST